MHTRKMTMTNDKHGVRVDRIEWPDIRKGACPETDDEQMIIVRENGPDECYHCGAEVHNE